MSEFPNMLWICTDQQRFDTLGVMGNRRIRTPHIDKLAEEGALLTHMFANSPICTPSRASFLTGRYPRTTRCRQNGQAIPPDEVLITKMLADRGYDCGLAGKLHLAPCCKRLERRIDDGYRTFHWSHHSGPQNLVANDYQDWLISRGVIWEEWSKPKGKHAFACVPAEHHQTTWCCEKAAEFLHGRRGRPWAFSVNIFDPHHPFDPPKEYLDRIDPGDMEPPRYVEGEWRNKPRHQWVDHSEGAYAGTGMAFAKLSPRDRLEVTAAYYAMIELIDDQVGRLLQALDESGQRDNTIVVFMSDHGEMLGDHGFYLKGPHLYDCALRVPFIARWPGRIKAGLRSDALVELVDLAPTLLEAAGMEAPARMQGRSFWPMLAGKADPAERRPFVTAEYYNAVHPFERKAWVTMWRDRKWKINVFHGEEPGELYDLEADPGEHVNLWDDPAHAVAKCDLLKKSFDASVFTMDPMPERETPW